MALPRIGDELAHALPPGTLLGDCVLGEVVGTGGFSIVYAATDNLGRRLAIKEYMPESLARRVDGTTVAARSERTSATFQQGLDSFVKEAKTLARFRNPAILPVYAFWEANGTAYMAMPLFSGRTLKQELRAHPEPVDEAWLRALVDRLLDVLEILHAERVWHRDIAPDNILLQDGQPMLLDFGAARRVIGEGTQTLTAILKPGYAPWEQYGEAPGLQQGPWTDLYALAAVMYRAISGKVPVASVSRVAADTMPPATEVGRGRYSAALLATIDRALAVRPADRPQSVAEFRRLLSVADDRETTRVIAAKSPEPAPAAAPLSGSDRGATARPSRRVAAILGVLLALVAAAGIARYATTGSEAPARAPAVEGPPAAAVAEPRPTDTPASAIVAIGESTNATRATEVSEAASSPAAATPTTSRPAAAPATTTAAAAVKAQPTSPPKATATATTTGADPRCRDLLAQVSLGQDSVDLREQLTRHKCY